MQDIEEAQTWSSYRLHQTQLLRTEGNPHAALEVLELGREVKAEPLLAEAREIFARLEARPWRERANALGARAAGEGSGVAPPPGRDGTRGQLSRS
jgi:hypothetical protein